MTTEAAAAAGSIKRRGNTLRDHDMTQLFWRRGTWQRAIDHQMAPPFAWRVGRGVHGRALLAYVDTRTRCRSVQTVRMSNVLMIMCLFLECKRLTDSWVQKTHNILLKENVQWQLKTDLSVDTLRHGRDRFQLAVNERTECIYTEAVFGAIRPTCRVM